MKRTITIKHTRQHGTLVYGMVRGDGVGKILHPYPYNFRGSEHLPVDEELGDPYWYQPHSRRSAAKSQIIKKAKAELEAQGFVVEVIIDDTTPAVGFNDLEAERYDRADARAAAYGSRAGRAAGESDSIRAANKQTYDALNGTPIVVGHYSESRHRNLLERLWSREGKAWALYDKAKDWRQRAAAAERYQYRREAVGTTLRRIQKLEKRLREIERAMAGRFEWLWDNPDGTSGSLQDQLQAYKDKNIPVSVLGREGENVRVHIGVSEHRKAVYAAEVVELTEEIGYWEIIIENTGVKVWTKADFASGDFANDGGERWYEVVKVNPKSLSVVGLFDQNSKTVATAADADRRSRHVPGARTLPYDKVKGRLSADEARTRFPEAFAEPVDPDGPPARPKRKRGGVRVEHSFGAQWENWYFEIGDQRYRAAWLHPDGWHSTGSVLKPCTEDLKPIRIFTSPMQIGKRDEFTGREIEVPGPVWHFEQIHNLVHAYVQQFAKEPAKTSDQG